MQVKRAAGEFLYGLFDSGVGQDSHPVRAIKRASSVPIRANDGSRRNVVTQLPELLGVAISRMQQALGRALRKCALLARKKASK
jgi:hypothetical protein